MKTYTQFKNELTEDEMMHGSQGLKIRQPRYIMVPMIQKLLEQLV